MQLCQVPQLVAAVEEVQAALLGHSKKLKQSFVEAATAHITLSVMAIPPERLREATAALTAASAKLRAVGAAAGLPTAPFQLTFRGLGHFRGQVSWLWCCFCQCVSLRALAAEPLSHQLDHCHLGHRQDVSVLTLALACRHCNQTWLELRAASTCLAWLDDSAPASVPAGALLRPGARR